MEGREAEREAATWIVCVERHNEPCGHHGPHRVLSSEKAIDDLQAMVAVRERRSESE